MRVLLLQPEDSPRRGPWSGQHWDLIVDLGKSSEFSAKAWSREFRCAVLGADSFRRGIADSQQLSKVYAAGQNRLIDDEGIDWWNLLSLLIVPDALSAIALQRLATEIVSAAECWATRPGLTVACLERLLQRKIRCFGQNGRQRLAGRAKHYGNLLRRFSPGQIKEIFLDKYDSGYRWRSRFAAAIEKCGQDIILLPSAYENVTRMAFAYAGLLPDQHFLMVATRQSAKKCPPPANVQIRDLAAYASTDNSSLEVRSLIRNWEKLRSDLEDIALLQVLIAAGVMDAFPAWIRDGVGARNAWRQVLEREPVKGVLCGDDSNLYTRLPVLLAARRRIPTLDFHHGALDGRYLLKELPSDFYLAKNEMERDYLIRICGFPDERVVIGAPCSRALPAPLDARDKRYVIFFSEPYEVGGMRTAEVYQEILPPLCRIARDHGRTVILKLHPFEGLSQRSRMIREVLPKEDETMVTVRDGPLSVDLLRQAWFGITVDSSCALDCLQNGVCCFLCTWLSMSPYGYMDQYARFGVGEALESAREIDSIPRRLELLDGQPNVRFDVSPPVDPALLQHWLTTRDVSAVRSAS